MPLLEEVKFWGSIAKCQHIHIWQTKIWKFQRFTATFKTVKFNFPSLKSPWLHVYYHCYQMYALQWIYASIMFKPSFWKWWIFKIACQYKVAQNASNTVYRWPRSEKYSAHAHSTKSYLVVRETQYRNEKMDDMLWSNLVQWHDQPLHFLRWIPHMMLIFH